MPAWLSDTLRLALGLGLLGGVFWLAFRRTPDLREDGGAPNRYEPSEGSGPP